jgi:GAF domain-containing protein
VRLTQTAEKIAGGDINIQAKVETADETGALAGSFNHMTAQLRDLIASLESRVAERTQSLELAAQVGRAVSQVRALNVMLKDATEIIRSQFDLYYVQVYLTDSSFANLVLQSGTGDVGQQLLERSHNLPLDTNSINGRAAIEKQSIIVADTAASLNFRPNPLLPLTQSEMAIPLMVAEKVVGVLDLQSTKAGSLNQDMLPAFEALAGQLAIAIQNANLLDEAEQARAEVEKQAGRLARTNWQEYLDAVHKPEQMGFVFENNQVTALIEPEQPELASLTDKLAAPISVSGEKLGALVVAIDEQKRSAQSEQLIFAVARQVSQQIENLRLLESANRYRAEVEQVNRLATVEGWKKYVEERSTDKLSYLYDLKEVKPYTQENEQQEQVEEQAATLPLKIRDETIGKISISGIDPNDAEAISLANDVAERLSAHIESMRQFEETKRGQVELDQRARQLAAVAEVSTVSSRELDIQKMLESVVFLTQRRFSLYHCHVFLYDKRTDHLTIQACGWKEGDEHEGTHGTTSIPLLQEQSLVARAGRTLEVVMVNDVHSEAGWLPNPLLPDTASEVAVPLVIGGQLLGVLDVQADRKNFFSAEDANVYTTLASQVATALQNAQSFARAQHQAEREAKLNIISQKIQSATTVEAVLQIAARELGHALGAPRTIAQLSLKDKQ